VSEPTAIEKARSHIQGMRLYGAGVPEPVLRGMELLVDAIDAPADQDPADSFEPLLRSANDFRVEPGEDLPPTSTIGEAFLGALFRHGEIISSDRVNAALDFVREFRDNKYPAVRDVDGATARAIAATQTGTEGPDALLAAQRIVPEPPVTSNPTDAAVTAGPSAGATS